MRIAVVVTARPSYSRVRSLLLALKARPDVELQVIVAASALLERYGRVVDVLESDGLKPVSTHYTVLEGENLETSARSTGLLLMDLAHTFTRLRPDLVVVHADRHEVLAAAQAARYTETRLAHCQGGEKTGSVDDDVRNAITQLAQYHLVSTAHAKHRVYGLTGSWEGIYQTGCPSIDLCVGLESEPPVTVQELGGAGAPIDLTQPYIIIVQHPTTDRWEQAYAEMSATLSACEGRQVIAWWPGEEAGAAGSSKAIRALHGRIHTVRNLPPARFLKLLSQSACLVGNSSVGIREGSYLGVPVVNVGTRQHGRERAGNVFDVPQFDADLIREAVAYQVAHGRYASSTLYGSGDSGERMADVLCDCARASSVRVEGDSRQELPAVSGPVADESRY